MAAEKKELILDLLARNKMGSETSAAARDIDKLGTAADKAGKQTEQLGKTTVIAGRETEKLGRSSADTKRRIKDLDDEIRKSTRELGELAVAFHEAGNQADKLDISKSMRKVENDIRRTTKSKGILAGMLEPSEVAKEGSNAGKSLAQGIRDGLTVSRGTVIGGVVALGVALAPQLGAIIAGAVVGGVGAGGLIGGVALAAASDEKIRSYATRIGKSFTAEIKKEARDSFSGPVLENLGKVEALATRAGAALGKIFKNLAPSLGPFVDNLVRSGDAILKSLVGASGAASGPLKSLGNLIENVSNSLGRFITIMAKDSKAGASGLDFLSSALTTVIDNTANFIHFLDMIHNGLSDLAGPFKSVRNWMEDHDRLLDLTNDGYKAGSKAAELYRQGIIGVAGSANDYEHYLHPAVDATNKLSEAQTNEAKAAHGQRDALAAVSKELRAQSDPVFALLSAQDTLRQKQDALTEATKKYGSKSQEARSATRDLATAAIDLQGAAGSLSAKFDGKLTPAMMASLRAANLTDSQIAAVAAEFGRARRAGDSYAKTYRARIITDYINRQTNIVTGAAMQGYKDAKAGIKKRASGGPVSRGTPYLVGENGPEVVVPSAAGRVLSAAGSRGMAKNGIAGQPMGGGGGRGQVLQLEVVGNDPAIVALIRRLIRTANLLQTDGAAA